MLLMLDGLDKYGPANSVSANVSALLTQGEWTSTSGTVSIVAPLSTTGYALSATSSANVLKTLSASFPRLIGGLRFSSNLAALTGIQFQDAGTNQAGISINTAGTISVRQGQVTAGTVLATSTVSVTANTSHYLEWDITFSNTGSFTVWLDGVAVIGGPSGISGSGDTTATANNSANGVGFSAASIGILTADDFYLLDATGPAPLNAPLLTSPRIETQFPASDGAVQFAVGAAVIGNTAQRTTGGQSTAVNQFRLRSVVPTFNCTITAINLLGGGTGSGTIQLRPVVYGQTGGVPGPLLGSGATQTGITASTIKTLPLTVGIALTAGTTYYIGHMCDIGAVSALAALTAVADDLQATSTFASGAPATAPAMTAGASTVIYGTVTTSANWPSVSVNPAQGNLSYAYDATVGHEDLYNFPALSVVPSAIYATAIKASVSKSDAGTKTVSVRQKSGATDSAGGGGTQAPGTSFAWLTSLFPTDPNGGGAWTKATLDAAQGGVRVES